MPEYSFRLPRKSDPKPGPVAKVLRGLLTGPDWVARYFCSEDVYQEPLDGHGTSYLGQLIAQVEDLGDTPRRHPNAERAIQDIRSKAAVYAQALEELAALGPEDPRRAALDRAAIESAVTWDDLVRFESALLQVLPDAALRCRCLSIRKEYQEIAGEEAWKSFVERSPADPSGDIEVLRAETTELMSELHWLYTSQPVQECQRARLLFTVLFAMLYMLVGLLAVLITVTCLPWAGFEKQDSTAPWSFPLIVGVMFAGGLGGSFSSLLRLQRTELTGNAVVTLWKLDSLGISAILSPFVGALSAVVLLFLFCGSLVQGTLFPRVTLEKTLPNPPAQAVSVASGSSEARTGSPPAPTNDPAPVVMEGSANRAPAVDSTSEQKQSDMEEKRAASGRSPWPYHFNLSTGLELAKLLVWCFIAGFSERFVPDVIDRLGQKGKA